MIRIIFTNLCRKYGDKNDAVDLDYKDLEFAFNFADIQPQYKQKHPTKFVMFAIPEQRGDEFTMKGGIDSAMEEYTLVGKLTNFTINILLVLDGKYGGDDDEELSGLTLGKHGLDVVEDVKLNPEQILKLYKESMNEVKTNPTYGSRRLSLDPLKLSSTPSSIPDKITDDAWRYLKAARALSSTQTHYYDMQIDEFLRSHSAFIESGSINDITMDIQEIEFYNHPFAVQKDTKKKVQKSCLRNIVMFLISLYDTRASWKLFAGTLDQVIQSQEDFSNDGITAMCELISNIAFEVTILHQRIKKYIEDYTRQFQSGVVPYSSRTVERGLCIFVLLRKLRAKTQVFDFPHVHKILEDLKLAYHEFPEEREMVPSSMMGVVNLFFDYYQLLECLIEFCLSVNQESKSLEAALTKKDVVMKEMHEKDGDNIELVLKKLSKPHRFNNIYRESLKDKWAVYENPLFTFTPKIVKDLVSPLPSYRPRTTKECKGITKAALQTATTSAGYINPAVIWEIGGTVERFMPPTLRKKVKTRGVPAPAEQIAPPENELVEVEGPVDSYSQRPYYTLQPAQIETVAILFNRKKGTLKWGDIITLLTKINMSVALCGGSRWKVVDLDMNRAAVLHAPHPKDECRVDQKNGYKSTLEDYFKI
ncbi:hypothetical protein HK098_003039 [Nowakowskiella sp. JEL0407]|nr:hypothetical protein HK098_003039 [Nowakowskiella sp. JEL0407]